MTYSETFSEETHPSGAKMRHYDDRTKIDLAYSSTEPRWLKTHARGECGGEWCVIHQPSAHRMRTWRLNWREDRGLMERICPGEGHGVGHPDPDDIAFKQSPEYIRRLADHYQLHGPDEYPRGYYERLAKENMEAEGVHGCDGCCAAPRAGLVDLVNDLYNRVPS